MKTFLDKKLVITSGETKIKTPSTPPQILDDIDIYLINDGDKIFNHSIYPSGLVIQSHVYADKIINYSNWNFVPCDDGNYIMEKP